MNRRDNTGIDISPHIPGPVHVVTGLQFYYTALFMSCRIIKEEKVKYPNCIAGERACPPEDCRGVPGYYELVEIIGNPNHPEYKEYISWLKGHVKNYYPYDPNEFNPNQVHFWNPKKRLRMAFSQES